MKSYEFDTKPEVIRAKGEADARIIEAEAKKLEAEALLLEARAKLHPITQTIQAGWDGVESFITNVGCMVVFGIIILAILVPSFFK